jgi:hypothetical protein
VSKLDVRRLAWISIFAPALLRAQDEGIGWDPKYVDRPLDGWQELFGLAIVAFALYGCWRLTKWFLKH